MNTSVLRIHNNSFLLFSLMGLLFGLFVNQTIYPVALYSVMISVLFVIFLWFYQYFIKYKVSHFIFLLMIFSFLIKLTFVFIFEFWMIKSIGIPFLSYSDDYTYDLTSSSILRAWEFRGFGFYSDIRYGTGFYSGYPNLSAFAKLLFGDHYLVPRFLNVFFSTLTIPFFFYTLKYLSDNKSLVKIVTMLFSFSPIFIVYSSLQLKETILIFFVSTLIYGTVNFFHKGINIRSVLLVAFSMGALLFFRAAILLPYIVALIVASLMARENRYNTNSSRVKSFIWISLIILCFYFFWEYLYSSGLLSLTGEEYLESRLSIRGQSDSYQGTNDLGKLGIIGILLGPLLAMLSIFFPAPIYIQLDDFVNIIPYHYFPTLGYYAILPMVCISLLFIIKNYRLNKIGFFIILFLILYKLGQAGSKSILDSRQSMPAIYAAYLLLAYFDLNKKDISSLWARYKVFVILILTVFMFSVTFLRYIIRL